MRKDEMKHKWDEHKIRWFLLESAEEEKVPESLRPEQMQEWLRLKSGEAESEKMQAESQEEKTESKDTGPAKKHRHFGWWCGTFAAAACLALVVFAVGRNMDWGLVSSSGEEAANDMEMEEAADDMEMEEAADETAADGARAGQGEANEGTTYAQLYQAFDKYWKEQEEAAEEACVDMEYETSAADGAAVDDAGVALGADTAGNFEGSVDGDFSRGESEDTGTTILDKGGSEEAASAEDLSSDGSGKEEDDAEGNYGKTNQQEKTVEEADIIKNDGRYLYRVMSQKGYKYAVRIVDTEGGLKETARVGDFDEVQDIYVWKDKLVVIEPGWALLDDDVSSSEDVHDEVYSDIWQPEYAYCRIYVYDISDRAKPEEYHTFTIKGYYKSSRISDGYLYFFTSCDTERPKSEEELRSYIPMLDGEPLAEDRITLPEDSKAASYLVMASINMEKPDEFTDSHALVTSADHFYVSPESIYMTDTQYIRYDGEGSRTDSTILYRYSYKDGKMHREAQGTVPGTLRDDMAMNEYQGYLRMVTTVEHRTMVKVIDDLMEQLIGYDAAEEQTTNGLYVLDPSLKVVGKIEDLAPDERVYSARFMGNTGYFVTFRETDPLFSVDLTNPTQPKVLGELKISGFSEYLHFYDDNLLLGIGMEADEETGETSSMKLSMFDISDPADVKEQSKTELTGFEYTEIFYNYRAVLIDTKKNLFGFAAEKYEENDGEYEYKTFYMLFTFENGEFKKILEIDCTNDFVYGYNPRGTYIGDRFFLLAQTGRVEEYSLIDASKVDELKP